MSFHPIKLLAGGYKLSRYMSTVPVVLKLSDFSRNVKKITQVYDNTSLIMRPIIEVAV